MGPHSLITRNRIHIHIRLHANMVVYGAPGYYPNYGYVASDYGYYNSYNNGYNNGYYRPYGYGW
jgi:hypothetical protein